MQHIRKLMAKPVIDFIGNVVHQKPGPCERSLGKVARASLGKIQPCLLCVRNRWKDFSKR